MAIVAAFRAKAGSAYRALAPVPTSFRGSHKAEQVMLVAAGVPPEEQHHITQAHCVAAASLRVKRFKAKNQGYCLITVLKLKRFEM